MNDAITGIHCLVEDAVIVLVTPAGHNGIAMSDNRLQAMLQVVVNKSNDENLDFVEFKRRLLEKIKKETTSTRHVTKMTAAIFGNQDFIASVAVTVKKRTE